MKSKLRDNRMMKFTLGGLCALVLFFLGCSVSDNDLSANRIELSGALLTSFNSAGFRVEAGSGTGDDVINDVKVDSQGRIVMVGSTTSAANGTDLLVMRLLEDGSPDTSFSSDGVFTHDLVGLNDEGIGFSITSAGDYIIAGKTTDSGGDEDSVLWKVTSAGEIDVGFSPGGSIDGAIRNTRFALGTTEDNGNDSAVAVFEDFGGDLLVVGNFTNSSNRKTVFYAKMDATASSSVTDFDPVENDGSVVTTVSSGDATVTHAFHDESEGRVYILGSAVNSSSDTDGFVMKFFESEGTLESEFGTNGIATYANIAGTNVNEQVNALDKVGNSLAICGTSNSRPVLLVVNATTGNNSPNFNSGSPLQFSTNAGGGGAGSANAVLVDKSKNIYCVGQSSNGANDDLAVWRVTSGGVEDTDFNSNGFFSHNNAGGGGGADLGNSAGFALCQKKMFIGGSSENGANTDAVVWAIQ